MQNAVFLNDLLVRERRRKGKGREMKGKEKKGKEGKGGELPVTPSADLNTLKYFKDSRRHTMMWKQKRLICPVE